MEQLTQSTSADTAASLASSPDLHGEIFGSDEPQTETSTDDSVADEILGADEADGDTEPEASEGQEQTQDQTAQPDRQQRMAELAKQHQLDLNNPAHRKLLQQFMAADKRNQDKDTYIQKLKDGGLTEWERSLQEQAKQAEQPKQADPKQQPNADRPVPAMLFNDGFDHLQSFKDFYQRQLDAWGRFNNETKDFSEINAIEGAAFVRRLAETGPQMLGPMIDHLVQQRLDEFAEKNLGDVVPAVRQTIEQRRFQEAQDFAHAQLMKTEGFADDWKAMNQPLSNELLDGRFRDTPLNRILGDNPWIQKIREDGPDQRTALVKTHLAQLRAARSIYRQQQKTGITPDTAKALMQNGAQQAERKLKDRGRQQLNSGANSRSGVATDSDEDFVLGLKGADTLGTPASALFRSKRK